MFEMSSTILYRPLLKTTRTLWDDFKKFVSRGNVVDLAIGLVIGSAFQAIVNSLGTDIILPPIGLIVGSNLENWFFVIRHGETPGAKYSTIQEASDTNNHLYRLLPLSYEVSTNSIDVI
jgi:hypothetical protein